MIHLQSKRMRILIRAFYRGPGMNFRGSNAGFLMETSVGSLDALRGPLITQLPDMVDTPGTTSGTLDLALAGHPLRENPFKKS